MKAKQFLKMLVLFSAVATAAQAADTADVTRATLPNGMRVVIVRNTLAPVVTVETNFMVGGNETPAGFPGMAHAKSTWPSAAAPA